MNKWKIAIVVVLLFSAGMLYAQNRAGSVSSASISKEEMESFLGSLPPDQLRQMNAEPEAKKVFVDRIKEAFALSLEAERLGIDSKPEIQSDLKLMEKVILAQMFRERKGKEQPKEVEVSQADKDEYFKNNPNAFEQFINDNPRFKNMPAEQRDQVKGQVAELQILVDRARRMEIDQTTLYKIGFKMQRATYLAGRMLQELRGSTAVSDDEVKIAYDAEKDRFQETRASHILVMFPEQREQRGGGAEENKEAKPEESGKPKTKEEAAKLAGQLLARAKAGEDFAALAKQYSDDTGSGQQGGDLGFFRKDVRFVPEFKAAVFKLKIGEVSDVVETQFGYHIIKMLETRTAPFDEAAKTELKEGLLEKKVEARIQALKAKNTIQVDETFVMPTPPPAPAQPPRVVTPHGSAPEGGQAAPEGAQPSAQPEGEAQPSKPANPHGELKHGKLK